MRVIEVPVRSGVWAHSLPATRGVGYLDSGLIFFLERCCCDFILYLPVDNDAH